MKITIIILVIMVVSQNAHALCLTGCDQHQTVERERDRMAYIGKISDRMSYRENSHDTGDVKNSVMGDVNIHVGHKMMDVRIDKGSSENSVNASVSSTIILGDMKQ